MTDFVPIAMPQSFAGSQQFDIQRVDYVAPEASGRMGGVQAGFPKWIATWNLATISSTKSDEMGAFLDRLRGSQRRFIGYEVGREIPRAHRDGSPFTANPATWSQAIAADGSAMLTLTGLLPGMTISPRDYVGFLWGGWKRALVRSLDGAVASGGGTMTIAIEPSVPTLVPSGAQALLANPGCLMKLTSETSLGVLGRRLAATGGKIVAAQDLVA